MMKRLLKWRFFLPLMVLDICLLSVAGWALNRQSLQSVTVNAIERPQSMAQRLPYDPRLAQQSVEFWASRVREDPQGALGYRHLAASLLQLGRETGDNAYVVQAEQAARRSLQIVPRRNPEALTLLSRSLSAQHRFPEALVVAKRAAREHSSAHRVLVDLYVDMGDYQSARRSLAKIPAEASDPNRAALLARVLEIERQPRRALELLREAQRAADRNLDMPHENVAWFHRRVGDRLAAMGRAQEATQSYHQALQLFPRDYGAMAALSRLAAARADWKGALEWGQQSVEIVPAPETVAIIGDAYAALGKRREAQRQYQLVEAIGTLARAQGVIYDRQRALYYADHNHHLDEALALARSELKNRQDIYTYDTLAWVCYRKGLLEEAHAASQKALAQGTQDALLWYHAGRINAARGDHAQARHSLERALSINPHFHPFAPAQARTLLTRLR